MRVLILTTLLLLASCGRSKVIEKVEYECYGLWDKREIKDKTIEYVPVVMNIIPGIIFSETIIVPAFLLALQTHCPIGKIK